MIHRMDPPTDPGREPMPERIVPMLARPGHAASRRAGVVVRGQVGRRARDRLCPARPTAPREPQPQRGDRRLPRGARAAAVAGDARRRARRRDRRVRRGRQAQLRAAATADARDLAVVGPQAGREHAGRVRDLRPALPRRSFAHGAAVHRAPRASRGARALGSGVAGAGRRTPARARRCWRRPRPRDWRESSPSGSTRATSRAGAAARGSRSRTSSSRSWWSAAGCPARAVARSASGRC